MGWVWAVGAAWVLLGSGIALVIGRSIVLADRRAAAQAAADRAADTPNVVVDRPPIGRLPRSPAAPDRAAVPAAAPRETPTIPGLPVARPPVGRPHVMRPHATRHRPLRRSGSD